MRRVLVALALGALSSACDRTVHVERYDEGGIYREAHLHGALRDGPFAVHFTDGTYESQGAYVDGLRHKSWTWFWPGGAVLERGTFERGMRVGTWTSFHPDGSRSRAGAYVGGDRVGEWRSWDPSGAVTSFEVWDRGTLLPAPPTLVAK